MDGGKVKLVIDMGEKFDNTTLREEIIDYLYENAVPTRYTIENMTDDKDGRMIVDENGVYGI